jgi:protein SCO1/2
LAGQAQTSPFKKAPALEPRRGKVTRVTDRGLFSLAIEIEGRELVKGANSVDLDIRDKQGRPIAGAEVTATPWLPVDGHGVSDKPAVTKGEGGKYRIDNIIFDRNGIWDLRISVKNGAQEDRAVFQFAVGMGVLGSQGEADKANRKYPRTVEYYKVPDVTILTQDGAKIKLRSYVDADKPVIIDFIYTTCTTVCPVLSAGFAGIQRRLGKDSNAVQLISVSIDPEYDRPERMKEYLRRYHATEGWDFITGSLRDIENIMQTFSCKSDKMNHQPLYLLHAPKSETWVRIEGLVSASDLLDELRKLEKK